MAEGDVLLGENWFDPLEAGVRIRGCFGAKFAVKILLAAHVEAQFIAQLFI